MLKIMTNTKEKVDKGFCLSYWNLSYRRKLIRTGWVYLFSFFIYLIPVNYLPHSKLTYFFIITGLILMQAGYNYWKYRQEVNKHM